MRISGFGIGAIVLALGLGVACGSDDNGGSGGKAGSGGAATGGVDAGGGSGGTKSDSSVGGTGGTANDAASDVVLGDGNVEKPVPGDIQFAAKNPLPQGEQLIFNDWNPNPNTVSSIKPDGTGELQIFQAYRVWAMGVSHDASKIAFACGDPLQEQHYGLSLGDAIQHTWLYDVATQSASVLAWGNLNDECHAFNAKDDTIYVCRRYEFKYENGQYTNKGYRLGRIKVADGTFEFLTPESSLLELSPQPNADESKIDYTIIEIANGKQNNRIVESPLPVTTPATIRQTARNAALSPDGTKLIFSDYTQQGALFSMTLDGQNVVKLASRPGTSAVWSPDGTKIAYLWGETQGCNHIEVVSADGSQADSPKRIRECGNSMVTDLAWINKP